MNNWSYSRYGTWKKCPAQLRFQMESVEQAPQHPAAARGQDIHKSVEEYILGNVRELPDNLVYYKDFFDHIREQGAIPEMPIALTVGWTPTEWDDPNRWWRGVLDCVVEFKDHVIIYDWKTGQEYGDHRDQREIYAAAFHSYKPTEHIISIHCYLDKKQNTISRFTAEDIPAIKKTWEEKVGEMLNDKRMVPNPGFYCRFCHFRRDNGGPCHF